MLEVAWFEGAAGRRLVNGNGDALSQRLLHRCTSTRRSLTSGLASTLCGAAFCAPQRLAQRTARETSARPRAACPTCVRWSRRIHGSRLASVLARPARRALLLELRRAAARCGCDGAKSCGRVLQPQRLRGRRRCRAASRRRCVGVVARRRGATRAKPLRAPVPRVHSRCRSRAADSGGRGTRPTQRDGGSACARGRSCRASYAMGRVHATRKSVEDHYAC